MNQTDFSTLFDRALANHAPEKLAFVLEDEVPAKQIKYGEFYAMVGRLRVQLRQLGVGPNQVVPILTERTPESFALMVAVMLEGAAFSMLNSKLPLKQLLMLMQETKPVGLVVDPGTLILDETGEAEFALLNPVVLESSVTYLCRTNKPLENLPTLQASGTGRNLLPRTASQCAQGAAVVAFTSGSTGRPKGVLLSPKALMYHIDNQIMWGLHEQEAILFPVTLAHNFGRNLLFACLFVGASIHLTEHFIYRKWVDIVKRSGINGITSLLQFWTVDPYTPKSGQPIFGEHSGLRFVHIGGQRISRPMANRLRKLLGPNVSLWKSYGQTEKGGTSAFLADATNPKHGKHLDSVGQAVNGVNFYISKNETQLAKANELGEVLYTGQGAFSGYLNDPQLTAQKRKPHPAIDAPDVLYSGDVGYLDEAGFLFIKGRIDAMFKTHGYRVLPTEIEEALMSVEGISAACVFGVPDQRLGDHVVGAAIEADDTISTTDIQSELVNLIPRYMIPKQYLCLSKLPRNAKGKLSRAEIKSMFFKHYKVGPEVE